MKNRKYFFLEDRIIFNISELLIFQFLFLSLITLFFNFLISFSKY